MTIETKLKELELSVIKAKAFERTLQIAIAHGMKIDIPTPIKAEEAEKLIQAIREAVSTLHNIQRMGNVPGSYAATAIKGIEKILNGGK